MSMNKQKFGEKIGRVSQQLNQRLGRYCLHVARILLHVLFISDGPNKRGEVRILELLFYTDQMFERFAYKHYFQEPSCGTDISLFLFDISFEIQLKLNYHDSVDHSEGKNKLNRREVIEPGYLAVFV